MSVSCGFSRNSCDDSLFIAITVELLQIAWDEGLLIHVMYRVHVYVTSIAADWS